MLMVSTNPPIGFVPLPPARRIVEMYRTLKTSLTKA
jgi:hypothetical protein